MDLTHRIKKLTNVYKNGMPSEGRSVGWERPYETLRKRWLEIPTSLTSTQKTTRLLELSDEALLAHWKKARADITTGPEFARSGWYHALYAEWMLGKKVMDVGGGFGVDSITFAQHGA